MCFLTDVHHFILVNIGVKMSVASVIFLVCIVELLLLVLRVVLMIFCAIKLLFALYDLK